MMHSVVDGPEDRDVPVGRRHGLGGQKSAPSVTKWCEEPVVCWKLVPRP
jgi:hypothetical protein